MLYSAYHLPIDFTVVYLSTHKLAFTCFDEHFCNIINIEYMLIKKNARELSPEAAKNGALEY